LPEEIEYHQSREYYKSFPNVAIFTGEDGRVRAGAACCLPLLPVCFLLACRCCCLRCYLLLLLAAACCLLAAALAW
jgi:hypothetical protein